MSPREVEAKGKALIAAMKSEDSKATSILTAELLIGFAHNHATIATFYTKNAKN